MRPINKEVARAVRYVVHEFVLGDGRIDLEMLAEGFAFGYIEPDADEIRDAEVFAPEFTPSIWQMVIDRAEYIRAEQGLCPMTDREEGKP